MILQPGERKDGYEVLELLGQGLAGEVHAVREVSSGSTFALKILIDPDLARSSRFSTEAGILTRLKHPNVVRCHAFLVVKEHPAMLLDLVRGQDLHAWLRGPGLNADIDERLSIFEGILAGVAAAHSHGIVHRDLKPANVLLMPWGMALRPRVADFGLAKLLREDALVLHATRTNTAMGTIGYMAPEQTIDAKRVDHRADLWSLGCIAYELLTDQEAFPGDQLVPVLNASRRRGYRPIPDLAPHAPRALVQAVDACLSPEPEQRPDGCAALAALMGLRTDLPPPLRAGPAAAPAPRAPRSAALTSLMPEDGED